MSGGVVVLQGVSVGRILAAADVPAGQAYAQLVPLRAERAALLAARRSRRHGLKLGRVLARVALHGHAFLRS